MSIEWRRPSVWGRAFALACVSVLGVAGIVGSGGGSLGFPPCTGSFCGNNNPPPPPVPSASIRPPYLTVQVGMPVSYSAETANVSGSLSYQWRRSSDGGRSYVDIAGATGQTYSLPSVNLGDDGAVFRVDVRTATEGTLPALSHLAVSASPGVVFADGEFAPADWLSSPVPDPDQKAFVHTEERVATGGNPDAYRKMSFQIPQGAGAARLFYRSATAIYYPAAQGTIHVIDYAEDCIALQTSTTTYTMSSLVIEQNGRRYLSNTSDICTATTWSGVATRASLTAQDFRFVDGPVCASGESCPDFSVSAPPLRFGYWRIVFGAPGDLVAHGIDNWKVTVWRR